MCILAATLAFPQTSPTPVPVYRPAPTPAVVDTTAILGLWEGTAEVVGSATRNGFRFSRTNGSLSAAWISDTTTRDLVVKNISLFPSGMIIIKDVGDGYTITFSGKIDLAANTMSGTVILNANNERHFGTWEAKRKGLVDLADEAKFKRILIDMAAGKTVPADDIAWATRYEQQKKAAGKAQTGASAAPAAKVNFFDTFDNDNHAWPIADNSSLKTSIAGSRYLLQTKFDSILIATIPTDKAPKLDPNRDFSIEVSFAFVNGKPTDSFGFVWGVSNDRKHRHSYGVLQNGNYYVGKHEGGKWVDEIRVSETNLLKKGSNVLNRLILRKRGNQLDLYIDTIRVTTIPYVAFEPNSSFGFQINGESSVSVDHIFVQQN